MNRQTVEIDGRRLRLSNPDKVLYPAAGFTKADLIDYYVRIAPAILPHLRGRPVTLKRFPDGVASSFFFEKNCPSHRPDWLPTVKVCYGDGMTIEHCLIEERAALAWVANLAAIELHVSLARADHIDQPTMVVFDLDPGEGVGLVECARVARVLRELLNRLELDALVKASGVKGLHVYVPLNTETSYSLTRPWANAIARLVQQQIGEPRQTKGESGWRGVTTNMSKAERTGRVFIDWSQNTQHKTTVCVYAMRAVPRPAVSMPLTWSQVAALAEGDETAMPALSPAECLAAVEASGDVFEGAESWHQQLAAAGVK